MIKLHERYSGKENILVSIKWIYLISGSVLFKFWSFMVFLSPSSRKNAGIIPYIINPLTAGHKNIWAGFKCPQCYARVNTMR
jgi:hypothetical protein